jgi:integrase/recombinase XerD
MLHYVNLGENMHLQLGTIDHDTKRWLKSYMRHLKYKDVSKNTLDVYVRILHKLLEFIEQQGLAKMLQDMNKEFFLDFIEYSEEHSKNGHFSKKTKQLYVSVLKSFFVYISDNNDEFYTFENEFKIAPKGVNRGKKVKYLTDKEVQNIVEYLDDMRLNRGTYYDFIYALGIKFMLFGGLRISEVLSLKLSDITVSDLTDEHGNRDIYEIHLQETKSGEEQTALIKIEDIQEELDYFRELFDEESHIFMSTKKNTLIHRSNFYVSVKNIMQKAGLNKKGLHIYRHTCAMQLYRKSKDILVTKEKLRHSDIKTTMIYAHAEKSDIARAMR